MKRLTLHCTDLDGWSWFNKLDSMTTEEMVGRLLRTEPPRPEMEAGTAWHSVLEDPPDEISTVERNGFTFDVTCGGIIVLPQVREVRAKKVYMVDGVEVTLTGKVDGIDGNKIEDHKLTFRPNPETYMDAYQWRAYLDIFNADVFEYLIYSAKMDGNTITVYDFSPMKVYRYPEMVDDLMTGMRELVGFVKQCVPQMITA